MENEEWRPVVGYEGLYLVSILGKVKGIQKGKILKAENLGNYNRVCLSRNKVMKHFFVHVLVALAFPEICGEWFEGAQVNHKDENTLNNEAWNLEWCDCRYNVNYGTGNKRRSETERNRKDLSIPVYQYDLKGNLVHKWLSQQEAGRNGYDQPNINACCTGRRKQHKGFIWRYAE